ncbi:uncharacterized protein LOC111377140 [Olea europaea var. sylvestris]|uniref:uncharacterized protein LOC111377140 n=1 Tax=Olea europaea var. sylvestris TaxID=158386 RepID=UPI000C1CFA97|nr:uncharacterized protein LOC111377140 [Olea europaea var. sylvestris]
MLDSVRAYTVQCANCSKWRFIPTKQKYEQIRETIAVLPFHCEMAREWRPEITCDDESDLIKDGSWLWAIDKPGIPQPPHGWQRILRIRAEGGTRFSDVYYDAPSGERFRSMVKVRSFLNEHPEYQGVNDNFQSLTDSYPRISFAPVLPSPPSFRRRNLSANWRSLKTFKMLDSVRAYTVQCANCSKWRFIPTKQKYEQIRETIAVLPFHCEMAREWRPEITCDDESDLIKDGSWHWAIDKPGIPQPPHGWQRILRIRAEGGTRFSDVYYDAPSGERFRSMVKVRSFLNEHPEYQGVKESQFSFQNPAPLEENYVRKSTPAASHGRSGALVPAPMEENYVRKRRATSAASHEMSGALVPVQNPAPMEENYERKRRATSTTSPEISGALVPVAAIPISWVIPDQMTDFHFGEEGNFASEVEVEAPAESLAPCVNDPGAGS